MPKPTQALAAAEDYLVSIESVVDIWTRKDDDASDARKQIATLWPSLAKALDVLMATHAKYF